MELSTTSPTANTTFWTEDQNKTYDSCYIYSGDWTYTLIPVYILITSVLGIVLNVFVLMVFCLHKKACSTPEIYLSNMAAADLVLVSTLIFLAVQVYSHNWTFGQAMCKIVRMSITMNSSCSIYFLVLVSIDRYLALVHPLSFERIRRPVFAKLGCLLAWILGFSFSVPSLIFRKLIKFDDDNKIICGTDSSNTTIITSQSLYFVFVFIIPVFIIFFCTVKIIKVLQSRPVRGVNAKKTDKKATTLVLAVLLAFIICWVPYNLLVMGNILFPLISPGCNTLKVFYFCSQIFPYLAYFNSVLNPILYIIVGKNFRTKVKELFK